MNSVSAQKKNPVRRGTKKQTLSTSQARANFADALGMAQEQSTVIGFDRYGRLVAAVVPIDAVRMLAGRGKDVEPGIRAKIERMARSMLQVAAPEAAPPANAPSGRGLMEESAALVRKAKEKRRRRKDKREKKKKKAKAAAGKRPRKISRKI